MAKRIITGLVLAATVVGVVTSGPFWLLAPLLSVVVLLALHEFLRLPGSLKASDRLAGVALGAVILAAAAVAPDGRSGTFTLGAAALATVAMLLVVLFTPHPMERAGARASHAVSGIAYVALLGACAVLVGRPENGEDGRRVLLVAAAVTWLNDTLAFAGGKLFGRHKLYEAVSPKKTWEGSIAGMAGSLGGAFAVRALIWPEADPWSLAGFALAGGILGQTGDLAESVFKRSYQVKDSGSLLPGHGGLLDRIDAFLFVAPLAWVWFIG